MSLELALVFGVSFVICFLMWFGVYLMTRIQTPVFGNLAKWFKIGDLGFFVSSLAFPLLIALCGLLVGLADGKTYEPILINLYTVSIYVFIFVLIAYYFWYFILRSLNGFNFIRGGKQ